eukprot:COSAG01_NODE_68175_length_265_cov_0.421687_1_plen_53_part_01
MVVGGVLGLVGSGGGCRQGYSRRRPPSVWGGGWGGRGGGGGGDDNPLAEITLR